MSKVYIFDVDGTLTPSRQKMTKEFEEFFGEWALKNTFYLVTGSDLLKLQEQMIGLEKYEESIFTCCGNQNWKNNNLIYDNKFKPSKELLHYLELELKYSPYKKQYGNHIEDRGCMINFSIVGRDCTQEQRNEYFSYDNQHNERKRISDAIKRQFPELDAVIGGQISIDIYPKGKDKSQILEHIKDKFAIPFMENIEYIFIGDRTMKGGNDYPLAKLMKEKNDCSFYQTENWKHTIQILEKLSD